MSRTSPPCAYQRLLIPALAAALLACLAWGVMQSVQINQLQAALMDQDRLQFGTQRQIDQCESNLRSAGIQLANLSGIVQEASAAAAQCLLSDRLPDSP